MGLSTKEKKLDVVGGGGGKEGVAEPMMIRNLSLKRRDFLIDFYVSIHASCCQLVNFSIYLSYFFDTEVKEQSAHMYLYLSCSSFTFPQVFTLKMKKK
jgi:hypothetical protein